MKTKFRKIAAELRREFEGWNRFWEGFRWSRAIVDIRTWCLISGLMMLWVIVLQPVYVIVRGIWWLL